MGKAQAAPGFGGAGFPNVLIRALRERGAKDLTLVPGFTFYNYPKAPNSAG